MTISSTTRKAGPFTGNGVTVAFPFAFKVFTVADVLVVQAVTATGVETTKTLTTDYTVVLNADQNVNPGGTITMLVPPPTGTTLVATSQVANLQPLDVTNGGGFYPAVLNASFDRVVIQVQQLAEKVARKLGLSINSTASSDLPTPAGGAVIGWNATGTALVNFFLNAGTSLVNLAASSGSSIVGFLQRGVNAIARTVQDKARESVSVDDFASPAGALVEIETSGGGALLIPVGTNTLTTGLSHLGNTDLVVFGQGYTKSLLTTASAGVVPLSIGQTGADNDNVNIKLSDFGVIGAAGTGHGMHLNRLHNLQTEGLRISNNGGDGMFADRCYAQVHYALYANNNAGSGFHAGPMVGVDGNDNTVFYGGRFLGNAAKGVHIEGSAPGFLMLGSDIEGNDTGLQIDAGTGGQSECVTVMGAYFENQIGKNISIGQDGGASRYIWGLTLQGNVFNPGSVSAAANAASINRVKGAVIANNHFSSVNLDVGSDVTQLVIGPNKYSSASGPWGTVTTEPMRYFMSPAGQDFALGFRPVGWDTRSRVGMTYAGDQFGFSMNAAMSSATTCTQDDATTGSSAFELGPDFGRLVRCPAGGGAAMTTVFSFDAYGLNLKSAKVDVIATASLPPPSADNDGRLVIEDAGAGNRNLILYGGGERFRIDGGVAF